MSSENQATVEALSKLLADTYTLYLKTQNFHWNVTGPNFLQLHQLFEEQYTELATAVDEIAERIRQLGARAPGSYSAFNALASIDECTSTPDAMDMVSILAKDQKVLVQTAQNVVDAAAKTEDEVSTDIGVQRQVVHEKAGWMLTSIVS